MQVTSRSGASIRPVLLPVKQARQERPAQRHQQGQNAPFRVVTGQVGALMGNHGAAGKRLERLVALAHINTLDSKK